MISYRVTNLLVIGLLVASTATASATQNVVAPAPEQLPITQQPRDLQMELRFAGASNRFQPGEKIPLDILLSSTTKNRYLEPCKLLGTPTFGLPLCRFFSRWSFSIMPEVGWVDLMKDQVELGGGPSLEVPNRALTSHAVTFPYLLTDRFRFDKPGEYHVRFSLEVGLNDKTTQLRQTAADPTVNPHFVTMTREIVLQIVPAVERR